MDKKNIVRFLQEVQGPNVRIEYHDEWVSTHCPLAPWRHPRGTDRTPSFGVHVEDNGTSIFNCFTCKAKGPLPFLAQLLERYTGDDYSDLYEEAQINELAGMKLPVWVKTGVRREKFELPEPIEFFLYDVYEEEFDHPYLADREVLPETAEELQLRVDPDDGHGAERILFPVFDRRGGFYGYTGRAVDPTVEPRIRDYYGLPKRNLLLGLNHIRQSDRHVILVEGLFDFAILFQLGLPVVASLHSSLTPAQQKLLKEINKPIVAFFDHDQAGHEGVTSVVKDLVHYLPVLGVDYPKRGENGFHRVKNDPAKLPDEVILRMVEQAYLL